MLEPTKTVEEWACKRTGDAPGAVVPAGGPHPYVNGKRQSQNPLHILLL